ncbi:MAG: phosphatase PAP2 family protein [Porphyromonadaceae bacterium]|nr:phosphatase PAP2 family protein [Porphyromonadaceae bacterium]
MLHPPLIPGETTLLKGINAMHSPVADAFMYMLSNPGAWIALIAVLLHILFYKKPWQEGILFLLAIGLCIALCDGLSSSFSKPFFARPRPTHFEGLAQTLHVVYNYKGGTFGFFSGHASNFTACAIVLSRLIDNRAHTLTTSLIVALVVYSRLYLGVHFISDVVVGIAVGSIVGYGVSLLHNRLRSLLSPLGHVPSKELFAPTLRLWLVSLWLFLLSLIAYSWQVSHILRMLH